jgi:hypothetical protein
MADKSKMKCNQPMKSDRKGKKRMVKACSGGTEKLIHYGQKVMVITILMQQENHSEQDITVTKQKIN